MIKIFLIVLIILLNNLLYCQQADHYIEKKWEKFYGGNNEDKAKSITGTPDGGFMIAGFTKSSGNGGKDMIILRLDSSGNKIWSRTYGGPDDDSANCIIKSNQEGYIIAGVTLDKISKYNYFWVVNIDEKGDMKWEKKFGGSEIDCAASITSCGNDGYIIAGTKESQGDHDKNIFVIRIDNKGQKEWSREYGERYTDDVAKSVISCMDGSFLLAGYTKSKGAGEEDVYLVKIDAKGNQLWDKTYGGTKTDIANQIIRTNDGKYLIVGTTKSKGEGEEDMYFIKITGDGDVEWEKTFGGQARDVANAAVCTADSGFVVTGYTMSKGNGKGNMYILKIDSRGNILWERSYGGKGCNVADCLVISGDNGFVTAGWSESKNGGDNDIWIIKLKDNSQQMINDYAAEKIKIWMQKSRDEKDEDYKNRISEVNKQKTINDLKAEAISFYGKEYGSLAENNKSEDKQNPGDEVRFRGGGDPFKGLNISNSNVKKEIQAGDYYALIIGIDDYSGEWPKLKNAVKDARAVEEVLRSKYKFDYFRTLYNEKATRENIINELEWLLKNVKDKDNLLIYYSGHGEFKQDLNKGYWVPVDANTSSTNKFISNSDIQTFLSGIKSKHTLLIADACFSGDIFRGKTISVPYENSEKYYQKVSNLTSRKAISSGGIEPVMDGGKDGHSVFAYYLLKALNGNNDKYYDASQLYDQIKIPVVNNSEQSPAFNPIKDSGDEGGQFIFIRK